MKLSFKKEKAETGLSAVVNPYPSTQIKLDGKTIGMIIPPNAFTNSLWKVSFAVIKTVSDSNTNCNWKWITMKKQCESEEESRAFVKSIIDRMTAKYEFHVLEE